MLRRMNVNIDPVGIELKEQYVSGMSPAIKNVAVCLTDGVRNHLIFDDSTVHKEILQICLRTGERGLVVTAIWEGRQAAEGILDYLAV